MRGLLPILRTTLLCAVSCASLHAQLNCPPINFLNVRYERFSGSSEAPAIVRFLPPESETEGVPQGYYIGLRHRIFRPYQRLDNDMEAGDRLSACIQRAPTGREAALLNGTPLGSPSPRLLVAPDLVSPLVGGGAWNFFGRNVTVLVGNPDYSLLTDIVFDVGRFPRAFLSADYDGNGRKDIAVLFRGSFGTDPGGLALLFQQAAGEFQQAESMPLEGTPVSMAQSDFDEDGNLDLAVALVDADRIALLQGNGDGTFQESGEVSTFDSPTVVMAADFNRDGNVDLGALGTGETSGAIFPGNGNGTFGAPMAFDPGGRADYMASADFNEDGNLDLALAGTANGAVAILLGNGAGGFAPPNLYVAGFSGGALFVADYDRDGVLDIVIGDGVPEAFVPKLDTGISSVLFGRGDGSFYAAPQYRLPAEPTEVVVADFNGDQQPDAAVARRNGISLLLGDGNGRFEAGADLALPGRNLAIVSHDFNTDGNADLATALAESGATSSIRVLLGNGNGTFAAPVRHETIDGANDIAIGDFNRDGQADLAVMGADAFPELVGGVSVLLGNPDGTFQAPLTTNLPGLPSAVAAGDWNQDGTDDVAVVDFGQLGGENAGGVVLLTGTGTGTFGQPVPVEAGVNPRQVKAADVNGDPFVDLVVLTGGPSFTFQVVLLLGAGDGTFQPGETQPTGFGPSSAAVADFDSDGDNDIIIAHCCGQTDMTYMLANGDGTFAPEVNFPGGGDPFSVAAEDLDGDDQLDLLVVNAPVGQVTGLSVLLNTSDGGELSHVSAASFFAGPLAADSIVTAFGNGLAAGTENVTNPLPNLAGTSMSLAESSGEQKEISLFLASPRQVNYLMPSVEEGRVRVSIRPGGGGAQDAELDIVRVSPGAFFLNSDFLAAAVIQRFDPAGNVTNLDVFRVVDGRIVAKPIDMGSEGDRVFILLFGTGFRHRQALSDVRLTVGETEAAVSFAGDQVQFPGLDQVNAELSRSLAGIGRVEVVLTVEGRRANSVWLEFQ